jgi:hypothetical protein
VNSVNRLRWWGNRVTGIVRTVSRRRWRMRRGHSRNPTVVFRVWWRRISQRWTIPSGSRWCSLGGLSRDIVRTRSRRLRGFCCRMRRHDWCRCFVRYLISGPIVGHGASGKRLSDVTRRRHRRRWISIGVIGMGRCCRRISRRMRFLSRRRVVSAHGKG